MLELEGINYWAVAAAWIINCAVGAFWYSPAGFAKKWTKYTGVNILKIPQNEATKILGFVILSGLLQAMTLAVVLNSMHVVQGTHPLTNGLIAGFVLWLGFTAATTVGSTLYQRLGWKFWWLNSSYFLIVMAINSIILAAWR